MHKVTCIYTFTSVPIYTNIYIGICSWMMILHCACTVLFYLLEYISLLDNQQKYAQVLCFLSTCKTRPNTFSVKINRKRSELVLWQNPYIHRKLQKAKWQHKNATKMFDYTTITDRLRLVCWSYESHPTGHMSISIFVYVETKCRDYWTPIGGDHEMPSQYQIFMRTRVIQKLMPAIYYYKREFLPKLVTSLLQTVLLVYRYVQAIKISLT